MIEPENEHPTRRKRLTMHLFTLGLALVVIPLAILLSACSQSVASAGSPATSTPVARVHQPTGTADLNWNPGTSQLTITIHMSGLTPASTHPAHIHHGTCQTRGGILFALHPVIANAVGVGISQTIIPNVTKGIPFSGWAMVIHTGPDLANADQILPIACVTIQNPRFRHLFHSDLNPTVVITENEIYCDRKHYHPIIAC